MVVMVGVMVLVMRIPSFELTMVAITAFIMRFVVMRLGLGVRRDLVRIGLICKRRFSSRSA